LPFSSNRERTWKLGFMKTGGLRSDCFDARS